MDSIFKEENVCKDCGKSFSNKGDLNKHIRTHTGEKPYKCDQCDKSFSQKVNLDRHILVHAGIKPYKCLLCGKSYSQNGYLSIHMRTHSGEKPYTCEYCNRSFSQKGNLDAHVMNHTGEKPYKCEHCEKSFSIKRDLQKHTRTHTGEKPFKCVQCGKSCSQKGDLDRHMMTHSGEKPFKCDVCDRGFARKDKLKNHMIKVHPSTIQGDVSSVFPVAVGDSRPARDFLFCDVPPPAVKWKEESKVDSAAANFPALLSQYRSREEGGVVEEGCQSQPVKVKEESEEGDYPDYFDSAAMAFCKIEMKEEKPDDDNYGEVGGDGEAEKTEFVVKQEISDMNSAA